MIILVPVLVRREPMAPLERAFVVVGAAAITGLTLMRLTDPFPWPDGPPWTPLGIRSTWWIDVLDRTVETQFRVVCVLATIATADLVWRWAKQTQARRRGLGWLAVASGLMTATFVPLALPQSWVADLPDWLTPVLHLTSQLFFPAALLVAVLGQRISGLEFIIGRATLWGLLTGVLIAVYVAIVAIGGALLPDVDGVVVAIATAAVALLFTPVRRSAQRHIDALVRGDGAAPARAFAGVGRRLGTASDDTELLVAMGESVMHALRLGGLAIEVDWPSGARRLASVGEMNRDSIESRPLVVGGDTVGRLVVSGRRGELLDRSTSDSLDDLAPVVGIVVQLVARTRELSESRARIADARDEERRTLRRELHDGFGPALAGVALGLRAAEQPAADPPCRQARRSSTRWPTRSMSWSRSCERWPTAWSRRCSTNSASCRRSSIWPSGIGSAGTRPRGDRRTTWWSTAPSAKPSTASSPRRSATPSGTPMRRRAPSRFARTAPSLVVTVEDDGVGLPSQVTSGVGLSSMRERADGIGATLTVTNVDRGTRVELRVPSLVRVGASLRMTDPTIRVLVVDDHPVFRLGMVALLTSIDGLRRGGRGGDRRRGRGVLGGAVTRRDRDGPPPRARAPASTRPGGSSTRSRPSACSR